MQNEADKAVDDALAAVTAVFRRLELCEDERQFVNEAGRSLVEYSYELMTSLPAERAAHLRPIVMAAAIAFIIGPSDTWHLGVVPPVK